MGARLRATVPDHPRTTAESRTGHQEDYWPSALPSPAPLKGEPWTTRRVFGFPGLLQAAGAYSA